VPAGYPEETGLQLERCPAAAVAEVGRARAAAAHTAGRGKHTARGAAAEREVVREPVPASAVAEAAVAEAAVRSWTGQAGTTLATLHSWSPGSAAGVAERAFEVVGCKPAEVRTMPSLREAEAVVRQRTGLLAVTGLRRVLANLCCCCLHKR
jgi:hypothetical protein